MEASNQIPLIVLFTVKENLFSLQFKTYVWAIFPIQTKNSSVKADVVAMKIKVAQNTNAFVAGFVSLYAVMFIKHTLIGHSRSFYLNGCMFNIKMIMQIFLDLTQKLIV